jgi:copper chaperone CopZ
MKQVVFAFAMFLASYAMAQTETQEVKIKTSAVCQMCKKKIERDLSYEKGVVSSTLDVETKILTVTYNPQKTNPAKIKKAVTKTGYDADDLPAKPKAYKKLPECCKKDNPTY